MTMNTANETQPTADALRVDPPPTCSTSSTPDTDALRAEYLRSNLTETEWPDRLWDRLREMECKLDAAITALSDIEERYIDGCDTYEDWKFMGTAARQFFFPENVQGVPPADEKTSTKKNDVYEPTD